MTESLGAANAEAIAPQFNLQRVYLKDLSLEIPDAPAVFLDQAEPRLEFQIDTMEKELQPGLYEVGVRCTVTCRVNDRVGFLVEATQAAIFEILGVSADQLALLKGISCPSIIYPYLRANLADVIQRASFPPVHLAELNWEAFYQQRQASQQSANHASEVSKGGQEPGDVSAQGAPGIKGKKPVKSVGKAPAGDKPKS